MFKPKLEVPDFEYCKRLRELGYPQDGGDWYWVKLVTWNKPRLIYPGDGFDELVDLSEKEFFVKGPTIGELVEWLPSNIKEDYLISYYFRIERTDEEWFCKYERLSYDEPVILVLFSDIKLSNALAKMLIWLIKNGYVRFEDERMYKNFEKS